MISIKSLRPVVFLSVLLAFSRTRAATDEQGISFQGISFQGISFQGISFQGISFQGIDDQGISFQGASPQGISFQGISFQGISFQGISFQGISFQGISFQGMGLERTQLRGVDRGRGLPVTLDFRGIERADVQVSSGNLQGLQTGAGIQYVQVQNPTQGVRLQAGPTNQNAGSFLFAPKPDGTAADLKGTFWNMVFYDTTDPSADATHRGAIATYIADVETDTSNPDIYLYTVYYRQPASGQWFALCPTDENGKQRAMATPLNPRDWTGGAGTKLAFACTESGVAAKCARSWGYKPWVAGRAPFYNACLIAARADYCQNDQSYTRDGTLVDLFDNQGINNPVGYAFTPGSSGPMLHDEYQISTLGHVSDIIDPSQIRPGDEMLVQQLFRSGLQSSRYPDLDPGRFCPAAPYIDRCDATVATCYRWNNTPAQSYGAMVAVNSARRCPHSDAETGDALDPLCNLCTKRVCDLDPTCCGEGGITFYPRALAWDDQCLAIRNQVCRSSPGTSWPPGVSAESFSATLHATTPKVLRGAVGSFEGMVTDASGTYIEGWACDPDFPSASIPIQISIGDPLGGVDSTLYTAIADQPLTTSWRRLVEAECGDAGRHGFRFRLPNNIGTPAVHVYGIDLNGVQTDTNLHAVGAPFTLLRGGTKIVPDGSSTNPRAALWTGWIEAPASGTYSFCKRQPGTTSTCTSLPPAVNPTDVDRYRIWINGRYVEGNWMDAPAPGAFTEPPPQSARPLYLQKAVRYPVRIEYLRPAALPASSELVLLWSRDGAPLAQVPTSALYAMAQVNGTGLLGSFFNGAVSIEGLPGGNGDYQQTVGGVDNLWTQTKPPTQGLSVEQTFGARFEGQVVPPISGLYTFSADADGPVRITVDGQPATDTSKAPPLMDPGTCAHDICVTGGPLSASCKQGNFCAGAICRSDQDPACCSSRGWDAKCVEEVKTVCKLECSPTTPIPIELNAGWRYNIKVEYLHAGGTPDKPARSAKLRLMWALPNGPRAVIPVERLFPAEGAEPLKVFGIGTGVNAAYFFDGAFAQEYLNHVEAVAYRAVAPAPSVTLGAGLVCGVSGTPACSLGVDRAGRLALISAKTLPSGGTGLVQVQIKGGGAIRGASVRILREGVQVGSPQLVAADATDGGVFTMTVPLPRGKNKLTAEQTVSGVPSLPSAVFEIDVTDPDAPPPPAPMGAVQPPPPWGGPVTVFGFATANSPGTTVTITATSGDPTVAAISITVSVGLDGYWSGMISLPPGSWTLSYKQTRANGAFSDAVAPQKVTVALSELTVTAPDHGTLQMPAGAQVLRVPVQGSGAHPNSEIVVADGVIGTDPDIPGQQDSFVPISTFRPSSDGTFSGHVDLDAGHHYQIRIFQRMNGLDGPFTPRSLYIQPPVGSLTITEYISDGETIPAGSMAMVGTHVRVRGTGGIPPTGLQTYVSIRHDGTSSTFQPVDDNGRFDAPVIFLSPGRKTVTAMQIAFPLGGGAYAQSPESAPTTVLVRPSAPVIKLPLTGSTGLSFPSFTVSGTAQPGTQVIVRANGGAASPPANVSAAGDFSAQLSITQPGHYDLTATAQIDGAVSFTSSPPIRIAVGDVAPPTVKITPNPLPPIVATSAQGAMFNVASVVSAFDTITGSSSTVPLPASAINCSPTNTAPVLFPIGSTPVTCEVMDVAGNRGTTTFAVTVTMNQPPVITGTGLVAEAQGPSGAVVNYQVGARGFTADCAPVDSLEVRSCTTWKPAFKGLSFQGGPVLAQNKNAGPQQGTLYLLATGYDDASGSLVRSGFFKLSPGSSQWEELTGPTNGASATLVDNFVIGPGTPPRIYVPSNDSQQPARGLRISSDGGRSWTTALAGIGIKHIVVDPRDPTGLHLVALRGSTFFGETRPPGPEVYETYDGGATWAGADQGLPPGQVEMIAFDTVNSGRMYLDMRPADDDVIRTKLFRRTEAGGTWTPLLLPPLTNNGVTGLFVAPTADGCGEPQAFPTVFADALVSRDGGEHWALSTGAFSGTPHVVFDRANPCKLFVTDNAGLSTSVDGGRTWGRIPDGAVGHPKQFHSLLQDVQNGLTFYAVDFNLGALRSTDGGRNWLPLPATGLRHFVRKIGEVAVDPVDPNIVLLSSEHGLYRSTDGARQWQLVNDGIDEVPTAEPRRIIFDRFERNRVYAGYENHFWDGSNSNWAQSLDGGRKWARLANGSLPASGAVALDPVARNHWVSIDNRTGGGLTVRDNLGLGGSAGEKLVTPILSPALGTPPPGGTFASIDPFSLQMVPDANRTMVLSWYQSSTGTVSTVGDVNLFGFGDVPAAAPALELKGGGYGLANVVYDGSDGVHRLFVEGSKIGRDANFLYRATVDDARLNRTANVNWQKLGGNPSLTFTRLLIDPVGGGQNMYTIGSSNTLWESHDGGLSWTKDDTAPYVNAIWFSPADGALFATADSGSSSQFTTFFNPDREKTGRLWKRAPYKTLPVGARIFEGDLRVTCTGLDPMRPTAPGSTFPLGNTALSCAAKDVFGTPMTSPITISVVDTLPPVMTIVTPPAPATAPAGSTARVTFTVTATDAVDGSRPVTCTPASNSLFAIGVTTVTCTASDARMPVHTATLKFPVVVSQQGSPALAPPTITVPGPVEATGPSGAPLAVVAATASGTPLTPVCTPTLGTMLPVGTTPVQCTATAASLSVTRAFGYVVRDVTAPTVAVPGDITVRAVSSAGAWVTYAATASDLVDGALAPTCTPVSDGVFPIGATMVQCRAVDRAGNQAFKQFKVTVLDVGQALLNLPTMAPVNMESASGARVTYTPAPTATDLQGRLLPINCFPPSGTLLAMGQHTVTCSADAGSPLEVTGTFVVTVADLAPPVVTVSAPTFVEATSSQGAPVNFTRSATDLVKGTITPQCTRSTSGGPPVAVVPGATFPLGPSVITCVATDDFNNTGTASRTVTVRDTTAPTLTPPGNTTLTTNCTSAQNIGTATVSDAVTPVSQIVITITGRPTNNIFKAGVTTVTYTARDQAGNTSAPRTQQVTVNLGDSMTCCPDHIPSGSRRMGTSLANTITGGSGPDCIIGLGGNDVLRGGGGNDFISGGAGVDQLFGEAGNDRLEGGADNDTINGGADTDTCIGGGGTNTISNCNP